ncbi:flagellar export protein FliJ [Desulfovibrio ferrophilus]|uniref:Flagellar FliJ protein n=1 Tax=Desulfovibrio ferrophilus TaxID=241368 RepID=A0A2Z6B295_9BACT|nr:flagellar export protein FliJ [Desulfovibrio ferrophilus]BBD09624.1 flagellar export protein FliJ [Desulfovibrio ferrophilus]
MARFRFSLERVLEYRCQLEDQAQMDVAKALAAHNAQAEYMDGLRGKLAQLEASLYSTEAVTQNDLWLWRRYHTALREDIAKAEVQLQKLARILTETRQRLVARSRDKKLLERLKANQESEFRKEENIKEQRESDEMATVRFQHGAV